MKKVTISILFLLLCISIWRFWQYSTDYAGVDYYQYWIVGEYFKQDQVEERNFYTNEAGLGDYSRYAFLAKLRRKYGDHVLDGTPRTLSIFLDKKDRKLLHVIRIRSAPRFASTPFLYYFIGLFSLDDYSDSFKLFSSISLLFFIGGCVFLFKSLKFSFRLSMLLLAAILLFYFPLIRSQQSGNVNELAFLPFVLYLFLSRSPEKGFRMGMAGVCMAVSVAIKPLAILVCIYEFMRLLKNRFKAAHLFLGMACTGFIIYLITSTYYGFSIWPGWIERMSLIAGDNLYFNQPVKVENYSFITALRLGSGPLSVPALFLYILIPLASFSLIYFIKRLRAEFLENRLFASSMLIIVFLLMDKLIWGHYFVFLVAGLLATLKNILELDERFKKMICLAAISILFLIMSGLYRVGPGYYLFSFVPLFLAFLYGYTAYERQKHYSHTAGL